MQCGQANPSLENTLSNRSAHAHQREFSEASSTRMSLISERVGRGRAGVLGVIADRSGGPHGSVPSEDTVVENGV